MALCSSLEHEKVRVLYGPDIFISAGGLNTFLICLYLLSDPPRHAPELLPKSLFGWIIPLIQTPHSAVLEKVGLDAVVVSNIIFRKRKTSDLIRSTVICAKSE